MALCAGLGRNGVQPADLELLAVQMESAQAVDGASCSSRPFHAAGAGSNNSSSGAAAGGVGGAAGASDYVGRDVSGLSPGALAEGGLRSRSMQMLRSLSIKSALGIGSHDADEDDEGDKHSWGCSWFDQVSNWITAGLGYEG